MGAGPSFRWFNPDAGALPLSRFVRQGGGFDFPFPEATRKNWHAPVHSRAHETTMRIWGLAHPFAGLIPMRVPCPCRGLCDRAGVLISHSRKRRAKTGMPRFIPV